MGKSEMTLELERFLRENKPMLKKKTLAVVLAAFTAETGHETTRQWIATVADANKLPRRRAHGPAVTVTLKKKLEAKRVRQARWVREKRARFREYAAREQDAAREKTSE